MPQANDVTTTFHPFSNLPTEIRHIIWSLVPAIIEARIGHSNGASRIVAVKPHPLLSVCQDSRRCVFIGAQYFTGPGNISGIFQHFQRDFYRLHGLQHASRLRLKPLEKIIVPPSELQYTDRLLKQYFVDVRYQLVETTDSVLLCGPSEFRYTCQISHCTRWPHEFRKPNNGASLHDFSRSEINRERCCIRLNLPFTKGFLDYGRIEDCPGCRWITEFKKAGVCRNVFGTSTGSDETSRGFVSTVHAALKMPRPSVQDIRLAKTPLLRFVQRSSMSESEDTVPIFGNSRYGSCLHHRCKDTI